MAAQFVLSYPFRIDLENNRFATVNSTTDTYKAEQVQGFLRTEKGERTMFPTFGIEDPVFNFFDAGEFLDAFNEYYTNIKIDEIDIVETSGKVTDVMVSFL
tara:strand:- start:190 stop:492 length:303 start_codon:yes stop_codon:yes gene_type:complete